jgi:hypothetical protein
MRRGGRARIIRVALVLAGVAVFLLGLAQLLLPGIAASTISSRVARYGTVQSVEVSAWPALKLLWGSADSVHVRAKSLRLSPAQTAKLLWEARGADRVELIAASLLEGPLRVSGARFVKRGGALSAEARASEADVRAALPAGLAIRLLRSEGGEVVVRASGGLFGVGASLDAVAGPSAGRLVAHPLDLRLRALQLTLFSNPHVRVQAIGASVDAGRPLSYRLSISGTLR